MKLQLLADSVLGHTQGEDVLPLGGKKEHGVLADGPWGHCGAAQEPGLALGTGTLALRTWGGGSLISKWGGGVTLPCENRSRSLL